MPKKNGRGISSAHAILQVIKNFEKYTNQQIPLILRKPMESSIISGCEFSRLLSENRSTFTIHSPENCSNSIIFRKPPAQDTCMKNLSRRKAGRRITVENPWIYMQSFFDLSSRHRRK